MKTAITLGSILIAGLSLVMNNFGPLLEAKALLANRRRVFWSMVFGAFGFLALFTSLVLGAVEFANQYELLGEVVWTAMWGVVIAFSMTGLLCLLVAKITFPKPEPVGVFSQFDPLLMLPILEQFKHLFESDDFASQPAAATAEKKTPAAEPEAREDIRRHPHGDVGLEGQRLHHSGH